MWHFVEQAQGTGSALTLRVAGVARADGRPCPVAVLLTISTSELSEPAGPSARGQVTPGAHVTCWPHSFSRGRAPRERAGPQRGVQQGGPTDPHTLSGVCPTIAHTALHPHGHGLTLTTRAPGEHTPTWSHTRGLGVTHPSLTHTPARRTPPPLPPARRLERESLAPI